MFDKLLKSGSMKAQAAMEYLMTYGWAIFIIVLVAGALFYVISTIKSPESCNFSGTMGFSCSESMPLAYSNNSDNDIVVDMKIRNQFGKSTTIHKLLCTDAPEGDIKEYMPDLIDGGCYMTPSSDGSNMGAGSSKQYTGIKCCDISGSPISISPGNQLKANVIVWYNYRSDPKNGDKYSVHRRVAAHIVSNVLDGTEQATPSGQ